MQLKTLKFFKKNIFKKKTQTLPAAFKRYPKYFKISEQVISKLHEWVDRTDHTPLKTALDCCKMGSIIRAFNLYKSINLLLRNDHWEDAAILARAIFELLLNLEEIVKDEKKAEFLARKYLKFQKLQEYLHKMNIISYEIKTSRRPKSDNDIIEKIRKLTNKLFSEFVEKRSPTGWMSSWCNKSVYNLAKNARNRIHLDNYKILYSLFSDISHSGPAAVATFFTLGDTPEETERLFSNVVEKDRQNLLMVLSFSINWLLEILLLGSSMLHLFEADFCMDVMKEVRKLYEEK